MLVIRYHLFQITVQLADVLIPRISERHEAGNDIVIALDSTGIKVGNRGECMRHKWHVRKGYLKIHVAVDIEQKRIVSLEVTSEEVLD
jgi:hypothetical protein